MMTSFGAWSREEGEMARDLAANLAQSTVFPDSGVKAGRPWDQYCGDVVD